MSKICNPAEPAPTSRSSVIARDKTNSMHTQKALHHQSITRCHRAGYRSFAAKATADIFIQSLVLAGFCSDHTPRKQLFPILPPTTKSRRLPAYANSPIFSYQKNFVDHSILAHRRPQCVSRTSLIHAKSLNTYAYAPRHSPDDCYHDDSDNVSSTDANSPTEGNPILGTSHTAEELPFDLKFVAGRGQSDWSIGMRQKLNVPRERAKPTQESRTRLERVSKRLVFEAKTQPFSHTGDIKIIKDFVEPELKTWGVYQHLRSPRKPPRYPEPKVTKESDKILLKQRAQHFAYSSDLDNFLKALEDKSKSNQYVFSLYKRLPSPAVKLLTTGERRKLLHRFSHPPDRRRSNARNFLILVDDMAESGFRLSRSMYTSAIHFIAYRVPVLEERDLKDALTLWHRMENLCGIESDSVVFQILFRIASEAGQFSVADRLLSEMTSRGLTLSRSGQISRIYSYGKRRDVDGILRAFNAYVYSGHIIDTVVNNCLISSFLNAGELNTAEKLYSRMMNEHRETNGIASPTPWKTLFSSSLSPEFARWKSNAKRLETTFQTYQMKKNELFIEPLQSLVPTTPDTRTFQILLQYHCTQTGDLTAIGRLLIDMEQVFKVPPRAIVYYFLFQGFGIHSAAKGWTEDRLREVWRTFRRALYESYKKVERQEGDDHLLTEWANWENPLQSVCKTIVGYASGPSKASGRVCEKTQGQMTSELRSNEPCEGDLTLEETSIMEMFDNLNQLGQFHRYWYPDEKRSHRITNGVFLSRELNILILKAFGAHCDTSTLLRVFSQLERMWKPWKRLAHDVQGMKKELQKQLVKASKRERNLL